MKSTREFLERLVNDKEFAKKFESVKDLENLKRVAGGEGYDINLEEYKKIQKEAAQLSDEQLESAAGGNWGNVMDRTDKVFQIFDRSLGSLGNAINIGIMLYKTYKGDKENN